MHNGQSGPAEDKTVAIDDGLEVLEEFSVDKVHEVKKEGVLPALIILSQHTGEPAYDLQQCEDKAVAIMLEDLEGVEEISVGKDCEVKEEFF